MSLHLFSTFTEDRFIDSTGTVLRSVPGGPALFMQRVFDAAQQPYELHTGEPLLVEMRSTPDGEVGRAHAVASNRIPQIESGSVAVVSTVFEEWDPVQIAQMTDRVCLDIQGFVRQADAFGVKKNWDVFSGDWIKRVMCLKATEVEIAYLPPESVEDQKQRLLLITHGAKGVEVYAQGERRFLEPPEVVDAVDTLGAGDTFFAHVVLGIVREEPLDTVLTRAFSEVILHLKGKSA